MTKFGVSLPADLLKKFDRFVQQIGYSNRSQAIADAIRAMMVEKFPTGDRKRAGAIMMIYSHEKRKLMDKITKIQHEYEDVINSTTHIHLSGHECLEIVVVAGRASRISKLAKALLSTKGVKNLKYALVK